jgi:eukaryotic-like serine/threonine-protein kinase
MAQCPQCSGELSHPGDPCPHCGALPPDALIGQELLGRYRIVRVLAEGGMGRVYLAEQAVGSISRRVAVKVLRSHLGTDRQLVSRFSREAETLVRLTHPNTVQLFDFGALADGTLALVMEYVEGHTLGSEIARGPLPLARVERILTQLCGALKEAHAHGIVHRDLKPDNVLVADRLGHGDFVKVLDFGIAKVSAADEAMTTKLTQQGMIIGTPPYMSPEQFSGEAIDARSDVYSLGVIVYEMLTGELPFSAKTPWEWASKHLTAEPTPLDLTRAPHLAAQHALAIRQALAKRPDERLQSVGEFYDAFTGGDGARTGNLSAAAAPAPSSTPLRTPTPASSPMHRPVSSGASSRPSSVAPHVADDGRPSAEVITSALLGPPKRARTIAIGVAAALLVGGLALAIGRSPAPPPAAPPSPPPVPSVAAAETASIPPGIVPPDDPRTAPVAEGRRTGRPSGTAIKSAARPPSTTAPIAHAPRDPQPHHPRLESVPGAGDRRDLPPGGGSPAASGPASIPAKSERTTSPAANADVPPDLAQRIAKIRESSARPEMAVGLFQAALGRYGSHPALSPLRADLTQMGEGRIKQLSSEGRCAQAQALQRALTSIGANPSRSSFGGACTPP